MKLIVGLGNPGEEFVYTRHNVGFMVIDQLLLSLGLRASMNKKFSAEIAEYKTADNTILFVKPFTFMNNSGQTVRALMDFYKLSPADITVIHDEKDFPLGTYKIQTSRSSAGHNGVQSIIDHVGTQNFTRIRIGVGPENKTIPHIENYVMGIFSTEELELLREVIQKVILDIKKE